MKQARRSEPARGRDGGDASSLRGGALLLHGASSPRPRWAWPEARIVVLDEQLPPGSNPADGELDDLLAAADAVLIDGSSLDALPLARRIHQLEPDLQVAIVLETEERRRAMERSMLFAPGVGELWLTSPAGVGGSLAERAAGVTRQRRRYRRTRETLKRQSVIESPQRTERALISDAYLADLLQVLYDPVFSVDERGRILSANPAAERLLASNGAKLEGRELGETLGLESPAIALLERAAGAPVSAEVVFTTGGGEAGHAELLVTRVTGSDPPLFAVVLHDLTERQRTQTRLEDQALELEHQSQMLQEQTVELEQANEELLRQRSELESALATRSRFYAAMSHELRTPINAMMGYTGLALEGVFGELSPQLKDSLSRAQRAATHLHELVDDVLDLAKLEAGRIDVAMEPVDVGRLADDILLSVRPTAEIEGSEVRLECEGSLSEQLRTDGRRVRQILLNLLGNALKFGRGRPVVLKCGSYPGKVTFSVIDEGVGIPEADQPRIFEEFVQLDPQSHRGTGLGLPISRRLAELLGGTLTVSSRPGEGSTFTLTLPRK